MEYIVEHPEVGTIKYIGNNRAKRIIISVKPEFVRVVIPKRQSINGYMSEPTLSKKGLSYSFGFDYTFENNWLGGLYYSAIYGEGISGTRIDDLEQYYSTKGAGNLVCLSVGYNFK